MRAIVERQYERITHLLKANAANLHKAAGILLSKETITGEELAAIVTSSKALPGSPGAIGSSVAAAR